MMGAEMLRVLTGTAIAMSVALAFIGLLRKPLQILVGVRVAYWVWLLVPGVLAPVLLPTPPVRVLAPVNILAGQVSSAIAAATSSPATASSALLTSLLLGAWGVGAGGMLLAMFTRQRSLARMLGPLTLTADGFYRGHTSAPMLVGVWRPRVVVPMDFESRYSREERELILAHERAHASRHDVATNLLAAIALSLHWFNPLMYRALAWLRMDQELACDALVLTTRGDARRHYADALLKTQLATQAAWRLSAGCHWQSIHPLKERVAMLKRPLPTRLRRLAGFGFIAALTGIVTYATWAAQPDAGTGPSILVDLKLSITYPQAHGLRELATQYLVKSGHTMKEEGNHGEPLSKLDIFVSCTPYLPDAPGRSTDWSDVNARGSPLPTAGQILLYCPIRRFGEIVQQPSVITNDGIPAIVETSGMDGSVRYRLEVTATASPEKIAAAVKKAASVRRPGT